MKKKIILLILAFVSLLTYAQDRKIKVACVGNSVTYGYLLPDRELNCYPSQLQKMLGTQYEVRNYGKSGSTLLAKGHRPYIEQQEYRDALEYSADIVIIHLGLNDTDPRNWPNHRDSFFGDYLDLINSLKKVNANAKIWICRMSPITHKHPRFVSGTRDWYRQIQQAIEQIAEYANVGIIDLEEPLYNRPDLLPDALHPNTEGAGIIARSIFSTLTGKYGGLQLSPLYSDNMVLQRNMPLTIQGIADAGEKITVRIGSQKQVTSTLANGKWQVTLDPLKEGNNYILAIASPNRSLIYNNVAVGEVWLCSGQSNMAFPLSKDTDYSKVANQLDNPDIRLFDMQPRHETYAKEWDKQFLDSLNRLEYFTKSSWVESDKKSASSFSAVAYCFGKMLADSLGVPVGLIHNAVGGSPLESWIDRRTLESGFPEIMTDWTKNDFIQDWVRSRAMLNIKKSDNTEQRHPYEPCYLFESGIMPLENYPVKGVIWYQGESNAHNIEAYERLFPLFVDSWRNNWKNPELPFYYVQLSSIDRPSWTWFRDSQRQMMNKTPHTYMTVSSDKGDSLDVHPPYKKEIGQRLGRWALNKTYRKTHIAPSGPLFRSVDFREGAASISFDHADGLSTPDKTEITGFEIAEVDGLYYPAKAKVDGDILKVWSAQVSNPKYVRYGWQPFTRANLINSSGLPASTFRTENKNKPDKMNKTIERLPDYPIKGGVSAPFAGICGNKLVVAGGCNFPNTPASEGGKKEFNNDIFYLDTSKPDSNWIKGEPLPYKVAYGAYVTTGNGIVCIGGQNDEGTVNKVVRIYFDEKVQKMKVEDLPALPVGIFNAGAAITDRTIYVTGGVSFDGKSGYTYSLNLDKLQGGWLRIPTNLKEERQQPVVLAQDGDLFMAGGYNEKDAIAFSDVLQFDFSNHQWIKVADIRIDGKPVTFVGAGSVSLSSSYKFFIGGVDYEVFSSALQRIKKKQEAVASGNRELAETLQQAGKEYMSQAPEWYKFATTLLLFDTKTKEWKSLGDYPQLARAGAGVAIDGNDLYSICGELKPGIRTAEVYKLVLKDLNSIK